ncbi:hypothetical protein [Streptosporangium sp. NPDC048865]|uniref:hypothetical protein n=1 Tax=Streptosporangium sp. NPDC048865 TaxID=3155766 RepID=UPI00342843FA
MNDIVDGGHRHGGRPGDLPTGWPPDVDASRGEIVDGRAAVRSERGHAGDDEVARSGIDPVGGLGIEGVEHSLGRERRRPAQGH